MSVSDRDHGRVDKREMYKLLGKAQVVFSIPISDSSPRSVYESIFCGACVVVTYGSWIEDLPSCMKSRIVVVDIEDDGWFDWALQESERICKIRYIPSKEAMNAYDEKEAMKVVCRRFYGEEIGN
jgi:hypothetical protein